MINTDNLKKAGLGFSALNTIGWLSEQMMLASGDAPIDLGNVDVEVHVPTKNEERFIERTLQSINEQRHVKSGEIPVILVDSSSDDRTQEIAEPYVDEIWEAPDGKLSARNWSMKKTDADIVVTADAGDLYPEGWLSNLLKPFKRKDVVATHGPNTSQDPLWKSSMGIYNFFRPMANMSASNSAIRTWAYWEAGGFRGDIDEFERNEIFREEEWSFPDRLREVGHVVYVPSAAMLTNMRHNKFSLQKDPQYLQQQENGERF